MRIGTAVLISLLWCTQTRAGLDDDCAQRRNLEVSIRACNQIIEESPAASSNRLGMAYRSRGDSYFANGEYTHAISDLGMAIILNPQDAGAYMKRGMVYDAQGDFARGIADFGSAIKLEPASATPYTMRAGAYERAGDKQRAISDLQRAIEIDPSLETARTVVERLKSQ